ncbi:MAG: endonuclease/exonuclease/phosphatase family protein [Lachnospiraceae bacterium]|nr:endonuclease/exonuclease/phosphatase family protein [Lachnospiraceae bacterium]
MKKILKISAVILGIIIFIPIAYIAFLRIIMYDPAPSEDVEYNSGSMLLSPGDKLSVLTFNIGYAGYNREEDFFMDGGKGVLPESSDSVMRNLSGIMSVIREEGSDVVFIQEVDVDSHRSFHINEDAYLSSQLGFGHSYACNYKVLFIPYPIPPLGKMESGISIYNPYTVSETKRISLPDTAPWYMKMGYLKRCVLMQRIPLNDASNHELVLMNFHMEAYTDEDKRDRQFEALNELLTAEHEKGNYVIAGGDFNQSFDKLDNPPVRSQTGWDPGSMSEEDIAEGFSLAVADNAPSCRSLEEPYIDYDTSQTYIIDGFIVSDNIRVDSVRVCDHGFEYSDHNPVKLEVTLNR